jgi:NAD(P)-dependent dehydrogenase (short-subunit alcohol dehydrogenase family)
VKLDKTAAIVTGGASGLGGATARALAGQGAQVFALDLADKVDAAPAVRGVTYMAADIIDSGQVATAVNRAAGCGVPLRTVVNCAGVTAFAPIVSEAGHHDLALFRRVIEVNLIGTFNVIAMAAEAIAKTKRMADNTRGVLINTASIGAFDGVSGTVAYTASKSGVAGMTLPAARDLASHGIRVMAIAPGLFDTPMFGMGQATDEIRAAAGATVPWPKRIGQPDEFAQLVIDIVDRDYLNAEIIRFDGGLRLG